MSILDQHRRPVRAPKGADRPHRGTPLPRCADCGKEWGRDYSVPLGDYCDPCQRRLDAERAARDED